VETAGDGVRGLRGGGDGDHGAAEQDCQKEGIGFGHDGGFCLHGCNAGWGRNILWLGDFFQIASMKE
ncbi:MAG: hypothetical protein J6T70_02105, partial [Bacteroidales bacterium]|nr:hypothetical protein [Bacteroidales bacterium]